MKYTKTDIKNLDGATLHFVKSWLWDTLRRAQMTENTGKTKAAREYAHARNHGLEWAFDEVRNIDQYRTGQREPADVVELLTDSMRE